MTVSILIVNWNSKNLLRACLRSIRVTCANIAPHIVVVDGGSFDGCAEMLAIEFPEVEFVQSKHNVGFGRANNIGLSRVTGDTVWVLNPDTEVLPGALQTLLFELEQRPDAGIVSPRLLNSDRSLQCSVHALPRPIRQALDSEFLRRVLSPFGWWAPPSEFAPAQTLPVEAVAGTAMLMRTATFRGVGGFTPTYFMYAEDMDLCFKILRAGYRIYHVPSAGVVHHGGASSSVQGSSFSAVMMRDALNSYLVANRSKVSALMYRLTTGVFAGARLLLLLPFLLVGDESRRSLRKLTFARWWAVLKWTCGQQAWTKRYALEAMLAKEAESANG